MSSSLRVRSSRTEPVGAMPAEEGRNPCACRACRMSSPPSAGWTNSIRTAGSRASARARPSTTSARSSTSCGDQRAVGHVADACDTANAPQQDLGAADEFSAAPGEDVLGPEALRPAHPAPHRQLRHVGARGRRDEAVPGGEQLRHRVGLPVHPHRPVVLPLGRPARRCRQQIPPRQRRAARCDGTRSEAPVQRLRRRHEHPGAQRYQSREPQPLLDRDADRYQPGVTRPGEREPAQATLGLDVEAGRPSAAAARSGRTCGTRRAVGHAGCARRRRRPGRGATCGSTSPRPAVRPAGGPAAPPAGTSPSAPPRAPRCRRRGTRRRPRPAAADPRDRRSRQSIPGSRSAHAARASGSTSRAVTDQPRSRRSRDHRPPPQPTSRACRGCGAAC